MATALPFANDGYLQVAHGWVKNSEGKRVSIKGMVFPYRIEPITAENLSRRDPKDQFTGKLFERNNSRLNSKVQPRNGGPEDDLTFYNSDAGIGYAYIELNPSSLDDITISSSGLNKPWQKFTFGFNYGYPSFSNFLIRWRIWEDRIDNPAPQNDFSNEIADFGVIWNQSVTPGTYKVEIMITQAGVTTDDTTLFVAQQFRDASNLQGEGDFEYGIDTVFNNAAVPSVGSSENQFWYDWDPVADGAYEETELDILETGQSNHLWVIKSSTTANSTQVFPILVNVTQGTQTAGNVFSLWFPFDNDQIRVDPYYLGARNDPNQRVVVEGLLPGTDITSIRLVVTSSAGEPQVQQKLFLWNYSGNAWVPIDTRLIGTTPVLTDVTYGGTIPITNFAGPGNRLRMMLESTKTNVSSDSPWDLRVDQVSWYVTRP